MKSKISKTGNFWKPIILLGEGFRHLSLMGGGGGFKRREPAKYFKVPPSVTSVIRRVFGGR